VHTAPRAQHDRPILRHCGDGGLDRESASAISADVTLRALRRIVVLTVFAAALSGCGAAAAAGTSIVFGISGGNIAPYRVSIQPTGIVKIRASLGSHRRRLAPARVRRLRSEIRQAHLESRRCSGVLPDIASRYIRVGSRTVTVHGGCERAFNRVWNDLTSAVGYP
jgi:hypothetical protein